MDKTKRNRVPINEDDKLLVLSGVTHSYHDS